MGFLVLRRAGQTCSRSSRCWPNKKKKVYDEDIEALARR
jgi:hypothetical protein